MSRSVFALTMVPSLLWTVGPELCAGPAPRQSGRPVLASPSGRILEEATAFRPFRFGRDCKGGAHTNGAWSGGALPTLAVASYAGNTAADGPLLQRIRFILRGENTPSCNGGYPAQHERMLTGSAVLVQNTPRVWQQLTSAERDRIDLLMQAGLVASAYTTSDVNYATGQRPVTLDDDSNFHRDWNPNYREGMIGMLLVSGCYFGPAEAQRLLDRYDHVVFVARLASAELSNTHETFTWKATHPASSAPTGEQIEAAVHGFRYYGKDITDPMALYAGLTRHTYGATVSAGLNDGAGISGAGRITKAAAGLPNLGRPGMLKEFDSKDHAGSRSSVTYAYDGFRPNLVNQIALIVSGCWQPGPEAAECLQLIDVGVTDLVYKLENGYINYAKGKGSSKAVTLDSPSHDYRIMLSLWRDVVQPYHREP